MKYREPQSRRIFQGNLQFKAIDIIKIFPGIDAQQQESTPHIAIDWFPWHTKYQILNTKNTAEQQQSSPKVYFDTITISLQVLLLVADTMSRLLLIFKY